MRNLHSLQALMHALLYLVGAEVLLHGMIRVSLRWEIVAPLMSASAGMAILGLAFFTISYLHDRRVPRRDRVANPLSAAPDMGAVEFEERVRHVEEPPLGTRVRGWIYMSTTTLVFMPDVPKKSRIQPSPAATVLDIHAIASVTLESKWTDLFTRAILTTDAGERVVFAVASGKRIKKQIEALQHGRVDDAVESIYRRAYWKPAIALMAAIALTFVAFRVALIMRVHQNDAVTRARGEPVTPAELNAWYPTPRGPNAADVYVKAYKAMQNDEALEDRIPWLSRRSIEFDRLTPLEPELAAVMDEFVAKNAGAMRLAVEASAIPECRYPAKYGAMWQENGWESFPLGHVRAMGIRFQLAALLAAHDARPDDAVAAIDQIFLLGDSLRDVADDTGFMVRVSLYAIGRNSIEQVLHRTRLSDEQLIRLSDRCRAAIDNGACRRAVVGEWCKYRAMLRGRAWLDDSAFARVFMDYTGITDAALVMQYPIMRALEKEAGRAGRPEESQPMPALPAPQSMIFSLYPSGEIGLIRTDRQNRAWLLATGAGLAAERFQTAHGRLPDALDELVPRFLSEVPRDPWSGAAMLYRRDGDGAAVYSVDRDGGDDGGRESTRETMLKSLTTDLPFFLPAQLTPPGTQPATTPATQPRPHIDMRMPRHTTAPTK